MCPSLLCSRGKAVRHGCTGHLQSGTMREAVLLSGLLTHFHPHKSIVHKSKLSCIATCTSLTAVTACHMTSEMSPSLHTAAMAHISHNTSRGDNCRRDGVKALVFLVTKLTRHAVLADVELAMPSVEVKLAAE